MKFSQMQYQRPDMNYVTTHLKEVKQKVENASSGQELVDIIKDYKNNFDKDIQTMSNLAHVRYTINTKDEFYDKENEFWDENLPIIETLSIDVSRAIYASKYRKELIDAFGEFYIKLLECELVLDDRAVPFMQKENELITKYSKIIANSKIKFRGKTYTYSQMTPLLQNTDRGFRKEAFEARNKFFEDHEEEFDQIYDEMVHLRHDMAKALGYDNYMSLRYKLLKRVDYNHEDVAKYREKILKVFSPLAIKLRKKQAEKLGIEDFKFYDRALDFKDGNSTPDGDYIFIVSNAQKMYRELSKETGEFFDFMVENELMDLLAKEGKRAGGYCTSFDKYKAPFIFSNFNGTNGDIDVITHEAGHAFQNYMSQDMILPDFIWPTYESCEIHSMSMEFLTWPWMNLFFGKNEDKFKYSALKGAISFLPYGVTVDHFQQFVYENPDATPQQRKEKYRELELMYQSDLDYDNEFLSKGTYWYCQPHIFHDPFYYIDYTLAQVCAFQYLIKYLNDKDKTLQDYITLCKAGGSASFFKLLEIGKLENPMTTDVLEKIAPKLETLLDEISERIK